MLDIDYMYVYQGSSVSLTTAELLSNDIDPQGQALTVVAVSEPGIEGVLTGDSRDRVHVHPEQRPDTDRHRSPAPLPRDRHRRPRHPVGRHRPHPRRRRPQPTTGRGSRHGHVRRFGWSTRSWSATTSIPTATASSSSRSRTPAHGTVINFGNTHPLHPQRRVLRCRDHHLHTPRHPRPDLHRAAHRQRQHDRQPGPVAKSASYTVQAGATLSITLSAVDPDGQPLTWSAGHAASRPVDRIAHRRGAAR